MTMLVACLSAVRRGTAVICPGIYWSIIMSASPDMQLLCCFSVFIRY